MSCELSVTDCFGRTVILEHSNWQSHLTTGRHPEVIDYHDRFPEVLRDPDIVIEARRDGQYHFHRKGIGVGRHAGHYLVVIVGTFGTEHKIVSWRFVPAIHTEGRVLRTR